MQESFWRTPEVSLDHMSAEKGRPPKWTHVVPRKSLKEWWNNETTGRNPGGFFFPVPPVQTTT